MKKNDDAKELRFVTLIAKVTPEQHAALRLAAFNEDVSMAEIVRVAIDKYVGKEKK